MHTSKSTMITFLSGCKVLFFLYLLSKLMFFTVSQIHHTTFLLFHLHNKQVKLDFSTLLLVDTGESHVLFLPQLHCGWYHPPCKFSLVYTFIHLVIHLTMDISISVYNLCITNTQFINALTSNNIHVISGIQIKHFLQLAFCFAVINDMYF